MKLQRSRIWTGAFRRFGPAARGSSWTGWSLWIDDAELAHFRQLIARRGEYPEAEALRMEIFHALPKEPS